MAYSDYAHERQQEADRRAAELVHHAQVEWQNRRDGKVDSVLLVGTQAQIAERVTKTLTTALRHGEVTSVTLRPIHPVNVEKLEQR